MKYSSFFKRTQTWILAIAIIFSVVSPTFGIIAAEADPTVTLNIGQVVADNYELTDAEEKLIASGLLIGDNITVKKPADAEELVSVDTDAKEITVDTFEDGDYTWVPVSVNIVVGDETKETVALDSNGSAKYTFDGNAFSVVANYELHIDVDAETQKLLLNAPAYIKEALEIMDKIAELESDLAVIQEAMPTFVQLAGPGMYVSMYGQSVRVYFNTDESIDATNALNQQMTDNGGKLDLSVIIEELNNSSYDVQYVVENAALIKTAVEETLTLLSNLKTASFFGLITSLDEKEYSLLYTVLDCIDTAISDLNDIKSNLWTLTTVDVVRDDLTAEEYALLDLYASAVYETTDLSGVEIKNPLLAATESVRLNMSMFDVSVKVVLNVTDTTNNGVVENAVNDSVTVTLAENATAEEILAAVESTNVVSSSLANWSDKYVDGKFNVTYSELPDALTEDIEYVITYSPNYYTVKEYVDGETLWTMNYPYGSVIKMAVHDDSTKAYDYYITDETDLAGVYYAQGSTYEVIGDAHIERFEGKAYTSGNFYQILANNYFETSKSYDILTSGALFGNEEVNVREPNANMLKLEGQTVYAESYASSYDGLYWQPYMYKLDTGTIGYFGGANEVLIPENFSKATVTYRLVFDFEQAKLRDAANLPKLLADEADGQLNALDRISNDAMLGNLGLLSRFMLNMFATVVADTKLNNDDAKNAALKECFTSVLTTIRDTRLEGDALKLYLIASEYNGLEDGAKLNRYYKNGEELRFEVSEFASLMTQMLGEDDSTGLTKEEKVAALETLMGSLTSVPGSPITNENLSDYVEKLTGLEESMASLKDDLTAPNAIINRGSDNLGKLTSALAAEGDVDSFGAAQKMDAIYLEFTPESVTASNKSSVSVTINVEGFNPVIIETEAFNNEYVLNKADVDAIVAEINAKLAESDLSFYDDVNGYENGAALEALVGMTAKDAKSLKLAFNWTYKEIEVEIEIGTGVEGVEDQIITMDNPVIKLPASADAAYRYDYYIGGVKVNGDSYTFNSEELTKLLAGELVIEVKPVYVLEENLKNFVDHLNTTIAKDNIVFALVKDANGEFSIVMKLEAAEATALMGSFQKAIMGMVMGSGYSYIGVGGEGFIAGDKIYLQSLVDALMNSGFGTDAIIKMMDANGKINNISIEGNVISNKPMTTYGGLVMKSTMELGSDELSLPLYVTLGSAPAQLTQIRNLFANQLNGKLSIVCENGVANITMDLPEKLYEAYLAALLVTGELDITDMNAINGEIALGFIKDHVDPLLAGDVTLETFENTLKKFGYNIDLSSIQGAQTLFRMLSDFYNNAVVEYDELGGVLSSNLDISSIIGSLNLGNLADMIAENENGLDLSIGATVTDLSKNYEALYVDVKASGITNKAGLTQDIASKVETLSGVSVVVLLNDIEGTLNFDTTTLLNLNGYTVENITSNGRLIIVDTYLNDDKVGGVSGNIFGNVQIVAGKYVADVSAFLKNGYVQDENGVVSNEYYDIVVDADNNINIEIDAGLAYTESMPSLAHLAADIACDLLFNGYTYNYLSINGNTVYDITVEDLVGIYSGTDRVNTAIDEVLSMIDSKQLSALVNTIFDDLCDFAALGEAIENDKPVVSYPVVLKPWDVQFTHMTEGNYITVDLASGEEKNYVLNFVIVGSDEDKKLLADLMYELGDTTDADINIDVEHGREDKNIFVNASADANIFADFSANPNYALMFSVIIADGIGASANQSLIEGIEYYYNNGYNLASLEYAFNNLTTAQVIAAVKNFNLNDDFGAMITKLGLDDVITNKTNLVELEKLYDRYGKLAAAVVRKADLVGGDRKLGSFADADGIYGMSRENIERILNANLFKGYTASADIQLTDLYFGVKLFGEIVPLEPEFVDEHGNATVSDNGNVAGFKVDTEKMYIYLDLNPDGISIEEFKQIFVLETKNADKVTLVCNNIDTELELVATGMKITAIASNKLTDVTDVVEYTVIVLGDVDFDGQSTVKDAIHISKYLVELPDSTGVIFIDDELEMFAADINCNGEIDIGDAAKIANKTVNWENYMAMIDRKEDEEESEA